MIFYNNHLVVYDQNQKDKNFLNHLNYEKMDILYIQSHYILNNVYIFHHIFQNMNNLYFLFYSTVLSLLLLYIYIHFYSCQCNNNYFWYYIHYNIYMQYHYYY